MKFELPLFTCPDFSQDKYKDMVRVVSIDDYSIELCGGCHVNNSSEVLMFKILQESSAASSKMGVRVKTNHLNRLLPIRTYNELLFQIPGMVSCKPDADVAASVIAGSNLMALLENTHEGDFPFYFRIADNKASNAKEHNGPVHRYYYHANSYIIPNDLPLG